MSLIYQLTSNVRLFSSDDSPPSGRSDDPDDVLLSDVHHETLATTIANKFGISYLSKAADSKAFEVVRVTEGFLFGENNRSIAPFVVSYKGNSHWVFFVLDTGSPDTYFSDQALKALNMCEDMIAWSVQIGGHQSTVHMAPPTPLLRGINVLGANFFKAHGVVKAEDYRTGKIKICIGGEWNLVHN
ncbi:hypothetical protein B9Z19DRAFT_1128503 [Tuber borchii]|uniref:Peptidase A2 domain-containing protein n=1 Tax=Tuber borchii TaxID=42251 RepID=A0A2T6ZP32_TUBBO|nr:hypothetical protein B9Z19DRAFT_1128503 [Tuber borchii]